MIAIIPAVNYFALMIVYWVWKSHFALAIANQEQDNKDVRPEKFAIKIEGLPRSYIK